MRSLSLLLLCTFLLVTITGCSTASNSPKTKITTSSIKQADVSQTATDSATNAIYLEHRNAFLAADLVTVITPYYQTIDTLIAWPEKDYCSEDHIKQIKYADQLNAASLSTTQLLHQCAFENWQPEDEKIYNEKLTALKHVIESYGNKGLKLESAINVHEIYEAYAYFSTEDLAVLDVEIVTRGAQTLYKFHLAHAQTLEYQYRFVSNFAYYKKLLENAAGTPLNLADANREHRTFVFQESGTAATIFVLKGLQLEGRHQDVVDRIEALEQPTPLLLVILLQSRIALGQLGVIDSKQDELKVLREYGLAEAQALYAQHCYFFTDTAEFGPGVY